MSKLQFIQRFNGEGWTVKNRIPFYIRCCDCGLVHRMVVVAEGKRKGALLGIAAERNAKRKGANNEQARVD